GGARPVSDHRNKDHKTDRRPQQLKVAKALMVHGVSEVVERAYTANAKEADGVKLPLGPVEEQQGKKRGYRTQNKNDGQASHGCLPGEAVQEPPGDEPTEQDQHERHEQSLEALGKRVELLVIAVVALELPHDQCGDE